MRVVGINGSARQGGNTAQLVRAVLRGADEAGCHTEMFELAEMRFAHCDACLACKTTARCIIADDMSRFYRLAPETDVLVLASPIYMDHVSSQMMAFLQRLYCYLGPPPELESRYPRQGVRAVIGTTQGAGDASLYAGVQDWMARCLERYWGIEPIERLTVAGCRPEPIITGERPELRRAEAVGRSLSG